MPRKRDLTYFAPRRRWKKKINGRVHYFGDPCNKSDEDAYRKAMGEYRKLLEQQAAQQHQDEAKARMAAAPVHPLAETDDPEALAVAPLARMLGSHGVNHVVANVDRDGRVALGYKTGNDKPADFTPTPGTTATTIAEAVEQYLTHFRAMVKTGARSNGRYQPLKIHLETFRDWAGSNRTLDSVNGAMVAGYHAHLLERLADEKVSGQYAHDLLGSLKQFIRWCWQSELTETLPRNLDALNIRIPSRRVQTLEPAEVRRIIEAAEGRQRLYVALASLCGMSAKDMADIRHHEVNLKAGTITRQRSKTRHHGSDVPTVTYKLPKPVATLLKEHATKGEGDDRVLVTETGLPLVHGNRCDSVRLAFDRLLKRVNKQAQEEAEERRDQGDKKAKADTIEASMKTLRATSANALEQVERFKSVTTLWLGHSPRSVKDKHYVNGDVKLLAAAVAHLAKVYGLDQEQPAKA